MKARFLLSTVSFFCLVSASAQIGIGTTNPNSTLDVRGSLSVNYRAFTSTTSAGTTDNVLVFTGAAASTLTLPDASTCPGRMYKVKNASSNSSPLTIATTSSQTIDGQNSWTVNTTYQTLDLISNGSNWFAIAETVPGSGNFWKTGGNGTASPQNFGTTSNYDLPFITNNSETMRLTTGGSLGIGTSTFDGTNPERLLIDAGASATDFQNAIVARGNTNSYVQFNIQNLNSGGQASTDIVATANNGTETANYIDLGINSGNYSNGASSLLNGANNAYIYSKGQDFVIGNASSSKSMIFFTGGDAPSNEKFRINSTGLVSKCDLFPSADNSYLLGKSGARWSAVWSANGIIQTSDLRLKKNIAPLRYGLREVMNMRPVSYDWKNTPGASHKIGLIAQEVRRLVPEVVVGNESTENLGMNYAELVPVLIKAIQEQQQQIEKMEIEIRKLKKTN